MFFFVTIIILALLLFIFKVEFVRCYISVHSYVICNARVQQDTSCLLELSNFLRIVHLFHPLVYNELQLRWRRKLPMMNRELWKYTSRREVLKVIGYCRKQEQTTPVLTMIMIELIRAALLPECLVMCYSEVLTIWRIRF